MTLADRLTRALAHRPGATKAALARAARVTAPSVSDWFSGQTQAVMAAPLIRAAQYLGVRPLWLATGDGPMAGDEAPTEPVAAALPFREISAADLARLSPQALRRLERLLAAYLDMQLTPGEPPLTWRTVAVNLADDLDAELQHDVYRDFVRKVDDLTRTVAPPAAAEAEPLVPEPISPPRTP